MKEGVNHSSHSGKDFQMPLNFDDGLVEKPISELTSAERMTLVSEIRRRQTEKIELTPYQKEYVAWSDSLDDVPGQWYH